MSKLYPDLAPGDIVHVDDAGTQDHMVITVAEHTARVRTWPLVDAPPAREVLRSQLTIQPKGGK